jgi:hypothetical protein
MAEKENRNDSRRIQSIEGLEGHRVRMVFTDGQNVTATLTSVTVDFDESRHLIYDKVKRSSQPTQDKGTEAFYSPGEDLVSCSEAPPEI